MYIMAARVTVGVYVAMAVAAGAIGRGREASIATLFAAANAAIFWWR